MKAFAVFALGAAAASCLGSTAGAATTTAAPGAKVFADHCQVCHQAEAVGVPGQFPRLAGRAALIAAAPEGRKLLATIVLNGMSGRVNVDSQPILGVMPPLDSLSDAEAASVLTYLAGLQTEKAKPAPFKPAEIAAVRASGKLAPGQVLAQRNGLAAVRVVP